MQGSRATGQDDSGDGAFAETNLGWRRGVAGNQKRPEECGEVGIVADDEQIFAIGALAQERLKVFECRFRGERGGVHDLGFVTGFGADQRSGLKAAFERA